MRCNEVDRHNLVHCELPPFRHLHHSNACEESQVGGHSKLVAHAHKTVLEAHSLYQILVPVALDCRGQADNAQKDQFGRGKVELLDTGKDDAADDNGGGQSQLALLMGLS